MSAPDRSEDGRPSKYWDALERTTPIVQSDGDVPTTTSMRIANGTRTQHKNVLELIRSNRADFEEFGLVAFETRPRPEGQHGGGDAQVAILNEEHATLLLTYMRNSDVVRDFKKRLVREFWEMRRAATEVQPLTGLEYARKLVAAEERAETERFARLEAESRAAQLAIPASAYNELVEAAGDYAVADAAKVLSRDENIEIGERRLFAFMAAEGWIFRSVTGRWRIYQTQVQTGRLAEKISKPYWHEGRGEMVNGDPSVRVTPKGVAELHKRLGGSGQLALIGAAS